MRSPEGKATTRFAVPSAPSVATLVAADHIYVELQPIVDLPTGRTTGVEALARCSVLEFASPLLLFASAVRQEVVGLLGRVLRRQACRAAGGQRLFLNVHPKELDEDWLTDPDDPIHTYDGEVVLELAESVPLERHLCNFSVLTELRRRGIRLALDDFGAGYCNLDHILSLTPDLVKIDRSLVSGAVPGSKRQQLLAALRVLCDSQGATVVAEGIEAETELAAVRASGIELGQGFLLGRPSPSRVQPARRSAQFWDAP